MVARMASSFMTAFFLKAFLRVRPLPVPGSLMTTPRDAGSSLMRANGVEERAASEEEDDEKDILHGVHPWRAADGP